MEYNGCGDLHLEDEEEASDLKRELEIIAERFPQFQLQFPKLEEIRKLLSYGH